MPSIYTATLLYDIEHIEFPPKTDPGNFWGTIASCIGKYDAIHDRLQLAGYTYVHDGRSWNTLRSAAGYWEMDKDNFAVVSGERLSTRNNVTAAQVKGMNNLYPSVKVGWIYENNIDRKLPVRWDKDGMMKLGSLGGKEGSANDINDSGQIVGYSVDPYGNKKAFIWSDGVPTLRGQSPFLELGTLGGLNSEALAINNKSEVVGWAEDENGKKHPFIWSLVTTDGVRGNRRMKDLLTAQFDTGVARAINDKGNVVGSLGEFPNIQAFYWSINSNTMLLPNTGGPTTVALSINESDEIVGYSFDAVPKEHPVKWENFNIIKLENHVVGLFPSMTLGNATAINEDGLIICTANIGQMTFPVLLTQLYMHPIPPLVYRRNFVMMGGTQNAGSGPVPAPDGQIIQLRPQSRGDKKRDDAELLQLMAQTALLLNDEKLKVNFYAALTKSAGKKAKKISRKIRKRDKKR